MVKQDIEVTPLIIEEILNEAAIEQVTVYVQLVVPINHVLVLEGIAWLSNGPRFRLRFLEAPIVPISGNFGLTLRWQAWNLLSLADLNLILLFRLLRRGPLGAL